MLRGEQLREEVERLLESCRDRDDVPARYVERTEAYIAAGAYERALYYLVYGETEQGEEPPHPGRTDEPSRRDRTGGLRGRRESVSSLRSRR